MFTYCNNSPIAFEDSSGDALKPCIVAMNDSTSGDRHFGTTSSADYVEYPGENDGSLGFESFEFSLFQASEQRENSFVDLRFITGDIGFLSCDLVSRELTLVSFDAHLLSVDAITDSFHLSFADLGNLSVSAGVKGNGIDAGIMVSTLNQSLAFDVFGHTLTITILFGALGAEISTVPGEIGGGYANGIGFSVTWS